MLRLQPAGNLIIGTTKLQVVVVDQIFLRVVVLVCDFTQITQNVLEQTITNRFFSANGKQLLTQQIQSAEVELVAELGHAPATVEQLLSLKPGDFIELDLEKVIQAKVDGVPVFDSYYGTSNGKYALRVNQLLTSGHKGWIGDQNV